MVVHQLALALRPQDILSVTARGTWLDPSKSPITRAAAAASERRQRQRWGAGHVKPQPDARPAPNTIVARPPSPGAVHTQSMDNYDSIQTLYRTEGFVVLRGVLDASEVDTLRSTVYGYFERQQKTGRISSTAFGGNQGGWYFGGAHEDSTLREAVAIIDGQPRLHAALSHILSATPTPLPAVPTSGSSHRSYRMVSVPRIASCRCIWRGRANGTRLSGSCQRPRPPDFLPTDPCISGASMRSRPPYFTALAQRDLHRPLGHMACRHRHWGRQGIHTAEPARMRQPEPIR